jgi:hypothetical protein
MSAEATTPETGKPLPPDSGFAPLKNERAGFDFPDVAW